MFDISPAYYSIQQGRDAIKNFKVYINSLNCPRLNLANFSRINELSDDKFQSTIDKIGNKTDILNTYETPLDFSLRYSEQTPFGIDKMALLGASYEQLGQTSIEVDKLDKQLKVALGENATASAIDLDKDGKIDVAEFATTILTQDSLSTDNGDISPDKINGVITNEGQDLHLAYYAKQNQQIANETYKALYNHYNLANAKETFLSIMG